MDRGPGFDKGAIKITKGAAGSWGIPFGLLISIKLVTRFFPAVTAEVSRNKTASFLIDFGGCFEKQVARGPFVVACTRQAADFLKSVLARTGNRN